MIICNNDSKTAQQWQSITPSFTPGKRGTIEFLAHPQMGDATTVRINGVEFLVYTRKFTVAESQLTAGNIFTVRGGN